MTTALAPPVDTRRRWQRLRWPTLLAVGVLVASVLLHLRDPHRSGSWGYCPWLLLTGTYCPGCGGLRAVNDLSHGDVVGAASSNLLFVASLPVLVVWWARSTRDRWAGRLRAASARRHVAAAWVLLALAVGFAVLRNTPGGAWLAP
jgi:hypothetical protein